MAFPGVKGLRRIFANIIALIDAHEASCISSKALFKAALSYYPFKMILSPKKVQMFVTEFFPTWINGVCVIPQGEKGNKGYQGVQGPPGLTVSI